MENGTPVQGPRSLIEKEEKEYQVEEKDKFGQDDAGFHHGENSTLVQSPGSPIEKEEKGGCNMEEKDKIDQKEVDFLHSHLISTSHSISVPVRVLLLRYSDSDSDFRDTDCVRVLLPDSDSDSDSDSDYSDFLLPVLRVLLRDDSKATERMEKMCLLKHYGLLKEELNWPDIISIADSLYTDGHLQRFEMIKICNRSQPRRKAIDILLKVVLGNASSVSAFIKIMASKNTLSYIAERINMTKISTEEMKRFGHLQEIIQGQRQNIYQVPGQEVQSSDSDFCYLLCHSYEKDVIDQMNDALLSNFFISISDHTGIVEQTHLDGKILAITDLMKKCPNDVYDVLGEVLTKNKIQHIVKCLEGNQMPNMKRKHWSIDLDMPTLQKRAKFEVSASDAVEKIARGLRIAPVRQKLVNEASKHMDLELKEAFSGSMGLMFSFKIGRRSQKLNQAFA